MLVRGIILVVAVAVLGMGIGYLISGTQGLNGGAVGGGLAARCFIIITLVIMYARSQYGSDRDRRILRHRASSSRRSSS